MREHKSRSGEGSSRDPIAMSQGTSQAFLKTVLKKRGNARWRDEVAKKGGKRRSYRIPGEGEAPKIPTNLRATPKELASRFFQLSSGHAMIAPFLKEKFGWTESGACRWCSGGRQSREHLSKECKTWKGEIRTLWKEVGEASGDSRSEAPGSIYKGNKAFCFGMEKSQVRPGDCSVSRLFADPRFSEAVLKFLSNTGVGKIKKGVVIRGVVVE